MLRKALILAFVVAVGICCVSGCQKSQPAPQPAPEVPKAVVEQKAAEPAKITPAPEVKEAPKPEAAPTAPKAEPAKAAPEAEPAKPTPPTEPAKAAPEVPAEPNPAK